MWPYPGSVVKPNCHCQVICRAASVEVQEENVKTSIVTCMSFINKSIYIYRVYAHKNFLLVGMCSQNNLETTALEVSSNLIFL